MAYLRAFLISLAGSLFLSQKMLREQGWNAASLGYITGEIFGLIAIPGIITAIVFSIACLFKKRPSPKVLWRIFGFCWLTLVCFGWLGENYNAETTHKSYLSESQSPTKSSQWPVPTLFNQKLTASTDTFKSDQDRAAVPHEPVAPKDSRVVEKNKSPLLQALNDTYMSIVEQRYMIDRINDEFPELGEQAQRAEKAFNHGFGDAESGILEALKSFFDEEYYKYYPRFIQESVRKTIYSKPLTQGRALSFINEMWERAKGDIPSPYIEIMLHYQYLHSPAEEITQGYFKTFRTADLPKAMGIDLQIEHPWSWKPRDSDTPNEVKVFVNNNGWGKDTLVIQVITLPPEYRKRNDEYYSVDMLKDMVPDNAKYVVAKPFLLNKIYRGGLIITDGADRLSNPGIISRTATFVVASGERMILLQFFINLPPDRVGELKDKFSLYWPLILLTANSLVIHNQQ